MRNYDSTMSYSSVKGCWRPLTGAYPYDGEVGALKEADEYKVEVCCADAKLEQTVAAIRAVHPYEIPVINSIAFNNLKTRHQCNQACPLSLTRFQNILSCLPVKQKNQLTAVHIVAGYYCEPPLADSGQHKRKQ